MVPFYKFVFELSSIFTIEAVLTTFLWTEGPPLVPMLILIACGGIYLALIKRGIIWKGPRRVIACLILLPLSLLAFYFGSGKTVMVFFAWVYYAMVLTTGRTDGNYYSVRSNYFIMTGALVALVCILFGMSYAFETQRDLLLSSSAPFVITMQVSGFLMLRVFREESLMKSNRSYKRYRRLEQIALVGLVALSWAGNLLDYLARFTKLCYITYVKPVIDWIGNALSIGVLAIVQFIGRFFEGGSWQVYTDDALLESREKQAEARAQLAEAFGSGNGKPLNLALIFTVVVFVIGMVILIAVIIHLISGRKAENVEGNVIETREHIEKDRKKRRFGEGIERSPRNSIRKEFKKSLIYYKRRKVPIKESMTVLEMEKAIDRGRKPATCQQISEAYCKARYCMREEPTWDEANAFKAKIKEQKS